MALPNDILDPSVTSSGGDLPALTPQWMLHRSTSNSVLESRHPPGPDANKGAFGGPDKWRSSSNSSRPGGQHYAPNGGPDSLEGRASRWREEERDAGRGLGGGGGGVGLGNRWSSLSTGAADPLKLVDDSGAGAEDFITSLPRGPTAGSSRWDTGFARGPGRAPDARPPEAHNWGASRSGKGRGGPGGPGDRWEASDLPGMGGPAPAPLSRGSSGTLAGGAPGGGVSTGGPDSAASRKFPERTASTGVADSWRSSGSGIQGDAPLPRSVSGFTSTTPGATPYAPPGSDAARPGSSTAGRGRGFTMGRGRGLKPPASAFFGKWEPSSGGQGGLGGGATGRSGAGGQLGDAVPKANRLLGAPRMGVRHYTIAQLCMIYDSLAVSNGLGVPASVAQLAKHEADFLGEMFLGAQDPLVPKPHAIVESHEAVVAETWSHPDATNQPVASIPGLGRGPVRTGGGTEAPRKASDAPEGASMLDLSADPPQGAAAAAPTQGAAAPSLPPAVIAVLLGGDSWVYRDPQGVIQGPFTKQDLIEWFEAGFFPVGLPVKSILYPNEAPFVPLERVLPVWGSRLVLPERLPPGFGLSPEALVTEMRNLCLGPMAAVPPQQPPQQQQQAPAAVGGGGLLQQLQGGAAAVPSDLMSIIGGGAPLGPQDPQAAVPQQQQLPVDPPAPSYQPSAAPIQRLSPEKPRAPVPAPADDDELLFPTAPKQQEPVVPAPIGGAAILPPRKKTAAVEAASKAPPKQPEPKQPEMQPATSPWDDSPVVSPQRAAAPAPPKPETKAAPWAASAAAATQRPQGKSLADIQREERAQAGAAAPPAPAPGAPPASAGSGWAQVTKPKASGGAPSGPSIREVQAQEQLQAQAAARQRAAALQQQQQQLAAQQKPSGPNGEAPSGITLADMIPGQQGSKAPAWGAPSPGGSGYEETAADLEGGADEEGIEEILAAFHRHHGTAVPPPQKQKQQAPPPQQQQQQAPSPQQQQQRPVAPAPVQSPWQGGAPTKSLKDIQEEEIRRHAAQEQQRQLQLEQQRQEQMLQQVREQRQQQLRQQQQQASPPQQQQQPETNGAPAGPETPVEGPLAERSPAFLQWCREQMQELKGDQDLSLIEFLLGLASSGEVADYTTMYLGNSPRVSTFTAEFIRRKFADIKAGGAAAASRKSKKKQAAAAPAAMAPATTAASAAQRQPAATGVIKPPRTAAAAAAVAQQQQQQSMAARMAAGRMAAPGAGAARPPPSMAPPQQQPSQGGFAGLLGGRAPPAPTASPSAWPGLKPGGPGQQQLAAAPPMDLTAGPSLKQASSAGSMDDYQTSGGGKKGKGKKGKAAKGQKVDLALLGFQSGVDYSVFEKPDP